MAKQTTVQGFIRRKEGCHNSILTTLKERRKDVTIPFITTLKEGRKEGCHYAVY
jgi:hypothetical protein